MADVFVSDQLAAILTRLQDTVVDVARMNPYPRYYNDFLDQVTHLEINLETLQEQAGELEDLIRRVIAIGVFS